MKGRAFSIMFDDNDLSSFSFLLSIDHLSICRCTNRRPLSACNIHSSMRSESKIPSSEISASSHHCIYLMIEGLLLIFGIICFFYARESNFTSSFFFRAEGAFYFFEWIAPSINGRKSE